MRFADLTEQQILALAISNEEDDSRIYRGFAEGLREQFPASAKVFDKMADEEVRHRTSLFDLYRQKFGEYLPLIRRQDVAGFVGRKPIWLVRPLGLDEVRKYAASMEYETARFYRKAAQTARDTSVRQLLDELADEEEKHEQLAEELSETHPHQIGARERRRNRAAHVRAAICAAGPDRTDGRLGLDPGAAIRRGFRHPQHLGDFSGRDGGLGRRRHLDGIRRSPVG